MRVFLDSVGCRLNQGEIERMARQFRQAGHELVPSPEECELVVINTCTVTSAAAADSRSQVRRAHRRNPEARIVLTGCWSTLEPDQALVLPGVEQTVPNPEKDDLVAALLGAPSEIFDQEPLERRPVPGLRARTRAFIKAQDGCDNHCTYCLTTIARGAARSLPLATVVAEVQAAVAGGAQEVVLTGVQLSAYGRDLPGRTDLTALLRAVLHDTDVRRLRLSSLEPWGLPQGLLDLWENPRLCRQLHLPLQSGSGKTLRRMGRPITPEAYARLVHEARARIPGLALTTDIIVGFPGEDEGEFDQSLAFIEAMAFSHAHVFTYSSRPGTPASRLPQRVPPAVAKARSRRVRQVVEASASRFRREHLGQVLPVLWETVGGCGPNGWALEGLTDNYLRVRATGPHGLRNQITEARLERIEGALILASLARRPRPA